MDLTVFGHTGFVGSHFVQRYCQTYDIYRPPRYSRRPNPYKPSEILYLISTTHNYHVFDDPTLDVKTNLVVLTEALESWYNNNPTGTFNFVSSWFVYGNGYTPDCPAYEGSECHPKGFYSITKHCAEQLVRSFADTFNLSYRILRLSNIIGPGDKGASKQKNALQYLIEEMKAGRPVDIYEKGEFYRNYMDVRDCVRALRLVMDEGVENTTYNIGSPEPVKFIDLINYAHILTGKKSEIRFIEQKPFHKKVQAKSFAMDTGKLHHDLKFKPEYAWFRTLGELCN